MPFSGTVIIPFFTFMSVLGVSDRISNFLKSLAKSNLIWSLANFSPIQFRRPDEKGVNRKKFSFDVRFSIKDLSSLNSKGSGNSFGSVFRPAIRR